MKQNIKNILDNSDYKEILSKGFSFLLIRVGGLLAGYIFTYLVSREFGASGNGLISLSFTLIMLVSVIGRLGIDTNLIRFFSNDDKRSDSGLFFIVLFKAVIISSILALIVFFLKETICVKLFKKPQLIPYIFWVSLTIPFWVTTLVCAGLFRALKKNALFAFFNNPGRFLFSMFILYEFIWFVDDSLSAIKAHFYGVLILALLSVYLSTRQFTSISLVTKSNSWNFLKQAYPMMLSGAIIVFLGWADTFVLGIYETDDKIGVYNVALKIAALTSFSLQAINSILAPKISKYFNTNKKNQFQKIIKFSTHLNFFITIMVISVIILFHKTILGLFGAEFLSGAKVLLILCIGQLINSLSGSVGLILQMIGQQKAYQNIVFIALIINIVLNFVLTPKYGTLGASIATVISISFWNIYSAIYLKRKFNIISYFRL